MTFETNDNYSKFQIIAQLFDSIRNEKNTICTALKNLCSLLLALLAEVATTGDMLLLLLVVSPAVVCSMFMHEFCVIMCVLYTGLCSASLCCLWTSLKHSLLIGTNRYHILKIRCVLCVVLGL